MKKLLEVSTLLLFLSSLIWCGFNNDKLPTLGDSHIVGNIDTEQDENDVSVLGKDQLSHTDSLESSTEGMKTEENITEDTITDKDNTESSSKNDSIQNNISNDDSTETESTEEQTSSDSSTEENSTENILIREHFIPEKRIYSFFQRSEAWEQKVTWSGEWSTMVYSGKVFSDFGCGFCCMANVYDTLSPYTVSPKDMFYHAMNVSGYAPSSAGAAISWGNMRTTLKNCGIVGQLYRKPSSYTEFQQQISQSTSAIVLVSSAYDNTYWTTTKGHYVSIWNYDEETDTVFLADPGKISRNRQRIPLKYVYNALKLSSDYQFLLITDYVEENNQWKGNGINEQWVRPFP